MIFINEELDMNNQETLGFYTMLQVFRNRKVEGAALQFPPTLTCQQRQIVHRLAKKVNLQSETDCDGFIHVNHPLDMPQDPH